MGKKVKQNANKRHLRPPLTFLDKGIYFLCIIFSFLGSLLLAFCFDDIQNMIAFSKPETIAYRSTAGFLLAIPFLMFLEGSALILFILGLQSKKPIFGSKKYKYGEYPFCEDCIPLFYPRKHKPTKASAQRKALHRKFALWCAVLLLFTCLLPFSLFGRDALCQDNRIEKINLINRTTDTYTTDDFAHLTIKAQYVSGYRTANYWKYEVTIEMNDRKTFSFSNRDFDWRASGAKDICLDKMLEIKSLFDSESITIKDAKDADKVADYLGFNESQQAKLNELFAS